MEFLSALAAFIASLLAGLFFCWWVAAEREVDRVKARLAELHRRRLFFIACAGSKPRAVRPDLGHTPLKKDVN